VIISNNKSLIIRICKNSDLKEIKIIDESLKITINKNEQIQKYNALKQAVKNKNLIISSTKSRVIGYLWYEYLWGYIPFISLIRIHKSFHRKGIGEKMIKFLERKMKKMNVERILSSTEVENSVAIKFHQNIGFKECGYFELSQWEPNKELFFEKLLTD
jgi:ribosomal protein S18 acetylase RimI-like enzyme|tara:strand:- start:557 stop:1033 length:477 start_codon:yes stop_codon:yes gene_type:complete